MPVFASTELAPFSAETPFLINLAQLIYGAAVANMLWNYPRLWRLTAKGGAQ